MKFKHKILLLLLLSLSMFPLMYIRTPFVVNEYHGGYSGSGIIEVRSANQGFYSQDKYIPVIIDYFKNNTIDIGSFISVIEYESCIYWVYTEDYGEYLVHTSSGYYEFVFTQSSLSSIQKIKYPFHYGFSLDDWGIPRFYRRFNFPYEYEEIVYKSYDLQEDKNISIINTFIKQNPHLGIEDTSSIIRYKGGLDFKYVIHKGNDTCVIYLINGKVHRVYKESLIYHDKSIEHENELYFLGNKNHLQYLANELLQNDTIKQIWYDSENDKIEFNPHTQIKVSGTISSEFINALNEVFHTSNLYDIRKEDSSIAFRFKFDGEYDYLIYYINDTNNPWELTTWGSPLRENYDLKEY